MSSVSNGFGSATNFLVGGKKQDAYNHGQGISDDELNRLQGIEGQIGNLYNQQDGSGNDLSNQFADHLQKYIAMSDQGSAPTQGQTDQATNFVDKTFTNPNQTALDQYNSKFSDGMNARASALGRNPNTDEATQQAVYGEGLRQTMNLQNQRAGMIQQQAQGFHNQDLSQMGTSSNFLNGLAQQAFGNRLNLLNGRTGLADYFQRDRLSNRTTGGGGTSSGLLTNINGIGSAASNFGGGLQTGEGLMSSFGGATGGSSGKGMMGLAAL